MRLPNREEVTPSRVYPKSLRHRPLQRGIANSKGHSSPRLTRRPAPNPRSVRVVDAIFHAVRGGCAWGLLTYEFPPWWQTSYHRTCARGASTRHLGANARCFA
jgi:transposase